MLRAFRYIAFILAGIVRSCVCPDITAYASVECHTCLYDYSSYQQLYPHYTNLNCDCIKNPGTDSRCSKNDNDVFFAEDILPYSDLASTSRPSTSRSVDSENNQTSPMSGPPGEVTTPGSRRRRSARRFTAPNRYCAYGVKKDGLDGHYKVFRVGVYDNQGVDAVSGDSCRNDTVAEDKSQFILYCVCTGHLCNKKNLESYIPNGGLSITPPASLLTLLTSIFLQRQFLTAAISSYWIFLLQAFSHVIVILNSVIK